MISVEIPVVSGIYLKAVLESLRMQTNQQYEVVIVNSSVQPAIGDMIQSYDVKEVKLQTGLLNARFVAHQTSIGERELFLDETRVLKKNALETLEKLQSDMVIVAEREAGKSIWSRLTDIDRRIVIQSCRPSDLSPSRTILLPRYFRRTILNQTFESLRQKLSNEIFLRIINGDHSLIYKEAYGFSKSLEIIKEPLIIHCGDDSLRKIVTKYYRYGKSDKIRIASALNSPQLRPKRSRPIQYTFLLIPLIVARSGAYLAGLLL